MRIDEHFDPSTDDTCYLVRFSKMDIATLERAFVQAIVQEVSQKLAADYLAQRGSEVLSKITPDAIATMAMAEAAAAVNETLHKKLPDKILEIERRAESEPIVLQRGIFGAVRRLR